MNREALMRDENIRMQNFLAQHSIRARVKYIDSGSSKGRWRLYDPMTRWTPEMAQRLNDLGFVDFDGKPLHQYSGNGGVFSVFVRGHNEFLNDTIASELVKIAKDLVALDPPNNDSFQELTDEPEDIAYDVVTRMREKGMRIDQAFRDVGYGWFLKFTRGKDIPLYWDQESIDKAVALLTKAIETGVRRQRGEIS